MPTQINDLIKYILLLYIKNNTIYIQRSEIGLLFCNLDKLALATFHLFIIRWTKLRRISEPVLLFFRLYVTSVRSFSCVFFKRFHGEVTPSSVRQGCWHSCPTWCRSHKYRTAQTNWQSTQWEIQMPVGRKWNPRDWTCVPLTSLPTWRPLSVPVTLWWDGRARLFSDLLNTG